MARRRVLLPQPLGPMIATTSRGATSSVTPSSATSRPPPAWANATRRPSRRTAADGPAVVAGLSGWPIGSRAAIRAPGSGLGAAHRSVGRMPRPHAAFSHPDYDRRPRSRRPAGRRRVCWTPGRLRQPGRSWARPDRAAREPGPYHRSGISPCPEGALIVSTGPAGGPSGTARRRAPSAIGLAGRSAGGDRDLGRRKAGFGREERRLVGPLPGQVEVGPPEVAVGRGLLVDRPAQVEGRDDRRRPQVEMALDELQDPLVWQAARPERLDRQRQRMGDRRCRRPARSRTARRGRPRRRSWRPSGRHRRPSGRPSSGPCR